MLLVPCGNHDRDVGELTLEDTHVGLWAWATTVKSWNGWMFSRIIIIVIIAPLSTLYLDRLLTILTHKMIGTTAAFSMSQSSNRSPPPGMGGNHAGVQTDKATKETCCHFNSKSVDHCLISIHESSGSKKSLSSK